MNAVAYSAIIPTYNRQRLLRDAIESAMRQSCPGLEIIVVDDGSTDGTADMVAREFPRVRYLRQENQGPAAARNLGIAASRGEFIAFLDSDDEWRAYKTGLEMDLFKRFPDAAMLAGNASSFVEGVLRSADTFAQRRIPFDEQEPRYFDWSLPIMKLGPACCTSGMVFRRAALLALGDKPFDEGLRLDEDWDLEFRFFGRFKGLLYPQVVCHRRVFDDGTRRFYSAAGRAKGAEEQRRIWRQQRDIIGRYVDAPHWDGEIRRGFLERQRELDALLERCGEPA